MRPSALGAWLWYTHSDWRTGIKKSNKPKQKTTKDNGYVSELTWINRLILFIWSWGAIQIYLYSINLITSSVTSVSRETFTITRCVSHSHDCSGILSHPSLHKVLIQLHWGIYSMSMTSFMPQYLKQWMATLNRVCFASMSAPKFWSGLPGKPIYTGPVSDADRPRVQEMAGKLQDFTRYFQLAL